MNNFKLCFFPVLILLGLKVLPAAAPATIADVLFMGQKAVISRSAEDSADGILIKNISLMSGYQLLNHYAVYYDVQGTRFRCRIAEFPNELLAFGAYRALGYGIQEENYSIQSFKTVYWADRYIIEIMKPLYIGWSQADLREFLMQLNPQQLQRPELWNEFPTEGRIAYTSGVIPSGYLQKRQSGVWMSQSYRSAGCVYTLSRRVGKTTRRDLEDLLYQFDRIKIYREKSSVQTVVAEDAGQPVLFHWSRGNLWGIYGCKNILEFSPELLKFVPKGW